MKTSNNPEEKPRTSKAVLTVFVVVLFMLIISTLNSSGQKQVENRMVGNSLEKSWHLVTKVDSSADANTPAFEMKGSQWRITYSCYLIDKNSDGDFTSSIASTKGPYGEMYAIGVKCPVGPTPTYYYAQEPGQYYLKLGSPNVHYTVSVEDYY